VRPSGESLTDYVTLLWIEVGQPCPKLLNPVLALIPFHKDPLQYPFFFSLKMKAVYSSETPENLHHTKR